MSSGRHSQEADGGVASDLEAPVPVARAREGSACTLSTNEQSKPDLDTARAGRSCGGSVPDGGRADARSSLVATSVAHDVAAAENGASAEPNGASVVEVKLSKKPSAAPRPKAPYKQSPQHDEHQETAVCAIYTPKQTYDHIVAAGVGKTTLTLAKQITLGILAGFYISFSFMLCLTVGGQISQIQAENPGLYNFIFGSVGFPLGLTIIMVAGADLFTSSCMYMMAAWIEGRVATYHLLKNWFISWWANLVGCLIMVQIVVAAELFKGKEAFTISLAHKKTSHTFGATVCRAIIANWLVNLAVWMANSARDLTGKAVGVYLPVSAFVTLGGEHVIANQFLLGLSVALGSGISIQTIIGSNFVPATIGNILGGAFFVATMYAGPYGTLYERIWARTLQLYVWAVPKRWRERIADTNQAFHDKLCDWVDWEYFLTPEAADISGVPKDLPADRVRPARAPTSGLIEAPRRAISAVVNMSRKPSLTPFERKVTAGTLGSDAV